MTDPTPETSANITPVSVHLELLKMVQSLAAMAGHAQREFILMAAANKDWKSQAVELASLYENARMRINGLESDVSVLTQQKNRLHDTIMHLEKQLLRLTKKKRRKTKKPNGGKAITGSIAETSA